MGNVDPKHHGHVSATAGGDCADCRELRARFIKAVRDVMTLNEFHLLAVLEEDPDPHRFDLLIHDANEKKQNAKYAYVHHRETHGSSQKTDETHSG